PQGGNTSGPAKPVPPCFPQRVSLFHLPGRQTRRGNPDQERIMFDWMVWTTPVAVFFSCIALMLVGMTVWEFKSPTTLRRGWLPMATTRGDRLFIGLLSAAYVNLVFIGLAGKFQE